MDAISQAIDAIQRKLPNIECRLGEQMKNHTSFRIGGPVRAMLFPECSTGLVEVSGILRDYGCAAFVMGNGTNLLVSDGKHEMVVIKATKLSEAGFTGDTGIVADAGLTLTKLAELARERGLTGFEFAHGIPGTLGGAILMNAGAYDGEMSGVVCSTRYYDKEKGVFEVTGGDHGFSYRRSVFTGTENVLLSTSIRLIKDDTEFIQARMEDLAARRRESQPLELPSAGSVFKRPKDGYAARLIEDAGLKGYTVGGAQVSLKHAGFIVNLGSASYSDMLSVINHVQETVLKRFNVELELEVKVIRGA